jgi:hypothetical protein
MARSDPQYVGKLPPDAAEDLNHSLREFREMAKQGVLRGEQILAGPGCAISEAQEGVVYQLDQVLALPLSGCKRSPRCACSHSPVVE